MPAAMTTRRAAPYGRRMADQAVPEARRTLLVEHSAQPDRRRAQAVAVRVREAPDELEREGKSVRFLRSTIIPADGVLLCVLEAASEERVREAYARAGLPFERLSILLSEDGEPPTAANPTKRSTS